jgi:hypothetical protein
MSEEKLLNVVTKDINQRLIRSTKLESFQIDYDDAFLKDSIPEGSMVVFLWKDKIDESIEVFNSVKPKSSEAEQILSKIMQKAIKESHPNLKKNITADMLGQELASKKVLASLRHGDRTLATNIYTSQNIDHHVIVLPYNGGELHNEGIVLDELYKRESTTSFSGFSIRRTPKLSELEKIALLKVTENDRVINIGISPTTAMAPTVAMVVAVVAVNVAAAAAGTWLIPNLDILDEEKIKELGNRGAAMELLKIRENILLNAK